MLSETVLATHGQPIENLSLPNMVTAAARYGFGRLLLGQLLFADWARFSHYVDHGLTPRLNQSMTEASSKFIVSPGTSRTIGVDATKSGSDLSGQECSLTPSSSFGGGSWHDGWRNISIALIDQRSKRVMAWLRQLSRSHSRVMQKKSRPNIESVTKH
jgi:hypothetical protein